MQLSVRGIRVTIRLRNVKTTSESEVSVLGHSGEILEYRPKVNPIVRWIQKKCYLKVNFMRAQRLYNKSRWPNPVMLKITHIQV
jgi:alpha-L-fucosidase